MYTLEDYLEYQRMLLSGVKDNSKDIFYNDSFVHAALVLKAIIDKSIAEKSLHIDMYCGKFSIFRDGARNKIDKIRENVRPNNTNSTLINKWNNFNPYNNLISSLQSFFDVGGQLSLIVERSIDEISNENIWSIIQQPIANGQMSIFKLGTVLGLSHFVVSGSSYRKENSDENKTALCCFSDVETSKLLKDNFLILKGLSHKYRL